ncbi:MAG: uracil-DNA glycosylase family protein [Planctomycetota bacterium]
MNDIITKGIWAAPGPGHHRQRPRAAARRAPGIPCLRKRRSAPPFLDRQIELIQPRVLIPLGVHATRHLLGTEGSLSSLRGQVYERGTCKVVPTFHPAFLLRNPAAKRDCWQDIQRAMAEAGLQRPGQ